MLGLVSGIRVRVWISVTIRINVRISVWISVKIRISISVRRQCHDIILLQMVLII